MKDDKIYFRRLMNNLIRVRRYIVGKILIIKINSSVMINSQFAHTKQAVVNENHQYVYLVPADNIQMLAIRSSLFWPKTKNYWRELDAKNGPDLYIPINWIRSYSLKKMFRPAN